MTVPIPSPIFRFIHVDNLYILLRRGGIYAPNSTPNDGLAYRTIHRQDMQDARHVRYVPCGPRGTVHDYVPFYFGYLSPMLLQLQTGRVDGYTEGQEPLIYLVSDAQTVQASGTEFVFTDGHGIPAWTKYFSDLADLDKVGWDMVYQRYWADDPLGDSDRQRRKQAEFMVHRFCPWSLVRRIAVISSAMKTRVEGIMAGFDTGLRRPVTVEPGWYY
jgi:hypothetical protein